MERKDEEKKPEQPPPLGAIDTNALAAALVAGLTAARRPPPSGMPPLSAASAPPSARSAGPASKAPVQVNPVFLAQVVEMGIDPTKAERGLIKTGNRSTEEAMNWIFDHGEDTAQDVDVDVEEGDGDDEDEYEDDMSEDEVVEELKMVLVVRQDLNMSPGKVAAQCVHAALGAYRTVRESDRGDEVCAMWEDMGEKTVIVRCDNAVDMKRLAAAAESAALVHYTCTDAGRTEVDPGTDTVLAIGPGLASVVDTVTGRERLF